MELLCIILLILFLYLTGQFFSYLKNQKTSDNKINAREFFNQKRIELQQAIDAKKEKLRGVVKVVSKWEPFNISGIYEGQNSDDIENQPWRKFEIEVATLFKHRGFEVVLGPGKNDDGKDIVIRRNGEVYLIQCKHYYGRKMVTVNEVRDFQGAIDLYEKQNNIAAKGIFITSGKSSTRAREIAKTLGIELWDKWNRKDKINNL